MYTAAGGRCAHRRSARACRVQWRIEFQSTPHSELSFHGELERMNGDGGINVLQLTLNASLFVKIVMLILIAFSFLSWVIIFRKMNILNRAMKGADVFEERFWSGADLAGLFREVTANGDQVTGIESIFEAGFREFARLRQRRQMDQRTVLEGARRGMRVALTRELDRLRLTLATSANVGFHR